MRRFTLLLCIAAIFSLVNSCSEESPVNTITTVQAAPDFRLLTPAYYRTSEDGRSLQIRFYESQRIYDLNKSSADFESVRKMIDQHIAAGTPMRVFTDNATTSDQFISIMSTAEASSNEIKMAAEAKMVVPDLPTIKKVIPSMDKLNEIFAFCKDQGCTTGLATIDYCIPFQYVVDGCYARAHKMRQILIEDYGYSCEKVFSYEGPSGFLTVDAGDCCVAWWYHVAPLVTVQMPHGVKKFVMDPSMFDGPVTIDQWTAAQENFDCSPYADFGYTDITPGYIYSPGGSTDNYYYYTNQTLQLYADLVTCP